MILILQNQVQNTPRIQKVIQQPKFKYWLIIFSFRKLKKSKTFDKFEKKIIFWEKAKLHKVMGILLTLICLKIIKIKCLLNKMNKMRRLMSTIVKNLSLLPIQKENKETFYPKKRIIKKIFLLIINHSIFYHKLHKNHIIL